MKIYTCFESAQDEIRYYVLVAGNVMWDKVGPTQLVKAQANERNFEFWSQ